MKKILDCLVILCLLLMTGSAYGQDAEMADAFRADGKIYVVVAIVLIVLVGLIAYLFFIDRKLDRIEKMADGKRQTKS